MRRLAAASSALISVLIAMTSSGCTPTIDVTGPVVRLDVEVEGLPPLTQQGLPDGIYVLSSGAQQMTLVVGTREDGSRSLVVNTDQVFLDGEALADAAHQLNQVGGPSALSGVSLTVQTAEAVDPVTNVAIDMSALQTFQFNVDGTTVLDAADMERLAKGQTVSIALGAQALEQVQNGLAGGMAVRIPIQVVAIVPAANLTTAIPADVKLAATMQSSLEVTPRF
jgi:hypothetical protein